MVAIVIGYLSQFQCVPWLPPDSISVLGNIHASRPAWAKPSVRPPLPVKVANARPGCSATYVPVVYAKCTRCAYSLFRGSWPDKRSRRGREEGHPRSAPSGVETNMRGGPVSRILSNDGSPRQMDDHSSALPVARQLQLPTRISRAEATLRACPREIPIWHCSRWGLPCGACCQPPGGLLPHRFTLTPIGSGQFHFCGAFRRIAPPGRYPAPLLQGVRTFLSSVFS